MSVYCPLAEALGIHFTESILNISTDDKGDLSSTIVPWNKGKTGLQENPFKGVDNRYSEETRNLIRLNTQKAMNALSPDKKELMRAAHRRCENKLWIHNSSGTHKRIREEQINEYLSAGWIRGRRTSHDHKTGKFISHNGVKYGNSNQS